MGRKGRKKKGEGRGGEGRGEGKGSGGERTERRGEEREEGGM